MLPVPAASLLGRQPRPSSLRNDGRADGRVDVRGLGGRKLTHYIRCVERIAFLVGTTARAGDPLASDEIRRPQRAHGCRLTIRKSLYCG